MSMISGRRLDQNIASILRIQSYRPTSRSGPSTWECYCVTLWVLDRALAFIWVSGLRSLSHQTLDQSRFHLLSGRRCDTVIDIACALINFENLRNLGNQRSLTWALSLISFGLVATAVSSEIHQWTSVQEDHYLSLKSVYTIVSLKVYEWVDDKTFILK